MLTEISPSLSTGATLCLPRNKRIIERPISQLDRNPAQYGFYISSFKPGGNLACLQLGLCYYPLFMLTSWQVRPQPRGYRPHHSRSPGSPTVLCGMMRNTLKRPQIFKSPLKENIFVGLHRVCAGTIALQIFTALK